MACILYSRSGGDSGGCDGALSIHESVWLVYSIVVVVVIAGDVMVH